jgi:hypothetical protein
MIAFLRFLNKAICNQHIALQLAISMHYVPGAWIVSHHHSARRAVAV